MILRHEPHTGLGGGSEFRDFWGRDRVYGSWSYDFGYYFRNYDGNLGVI
jgi:hypothetical protein